MKTNLLLIILVVCFSYRINTNAQTIPNAGFENWTDISIDDWETNGGQYSCAFVFPDNNSYQGNFAVQILTDACAGWAQTQFPITTHPLNLYCYVRTNLIGTDTVLIKIELLNNGNIVDSGLWTNTTNITSFTLITIPITQNDSVIDSAIIYMQSGNNMGTQLIADNLYFDFTSGIKEDENNSSWTLYPNPFNKYAILDFENLKNSKHNVVIYNAIGQLVRTVDEITTGQVKIEKKNLASGLYFFQLRNNRQVVATGKLMIDTQ